MGVYENGKKSLSKCCVCYIQSSKTEGCEQANKKGRLTSTYCDDYTDQPQTCRNCFTAKP